MANINNISNSNSYSSSTSLYGSRNVLTGLASGMDTETMIQNSVTGYQTKIADLQKQQTKIEWKQDAYRELIDQMNSITSKYTSYSSKTNLSSNSFFTSAKTTNATGANAEAVGVTGSTSSDIQINSVQQLATAARYSVSASALNINATSEAVGSSIDWSQSITKGTLSGTMTLKLGNSNIDIKFTENDKIESLQELVETVNAKLSVQNADVSATLGEDGTITFEATGDAKTKGDSVYIRSASGNLKAMLNVTTATSTADENRFSYTSFSVKDGAESLTKTMTMAEYLEGKTVDVTLDGVTKQITLGSGIQDTDALKADLQSGIDKAFGSGKITVSTTDEGGVRFDVAGTSGSLLKVTSSGVGEILGLGDAGVSNYFNTSRKLSDLLGGEDWLKANARTEGTLDSNTAARYFDKDGNELKLSGDTYYRINSDGTFKTANGEKVEGTLANTLYTDVEGNLIKEDADTGSYYRVNEKGDWLYSLEINGTTIGGFTKDTALERVVNAINSNTDVGVNVAYSNLTGQFVFTARETGAGGKIEFGDGLASRLFAADSGTSRTDGTDAIINATVNGTALTLKRSSNVVEMDGLSVTLKKAFNTDGTGEAVSFASSTKSDDVVDAIKSFVEDVNKLMSDVHSAYTTQPLKKSSGSTKRDGYEPLSEEDKADMSETAIKNYEEKAKTGLLFGDTDLSSLYSRLLSMVQRSGSDRVDMEAIGLTTTYSGGVTQLSLDEDKLRAALDSDLDKVKNVFTKTKDSGASSDGLMASIKTTLNAYGSISLGSQGILVRKAGTKLSSVSLLNNNLQSQLNIITKQIEQWQTRLSDKVDYYTKQFTQLEKLASTMNNQSSMLADLMGY